MDWNKTYSQNKDYFGSDPDSIITKFLTRLDRGGPVLDIGAGEGRNAIYLAREGFVVHALDPSRVAMQRLGKLAAEQGIEVTVSVAEFADHDVDAGSYSTILVMGTLPILTRDDIGLLAVKMKDWSMVGGLAFVTAFTTADPSYPRYSRDMKQIGRHSFALPEGGVRTFLEPDEAPTIFQGFDVLHHWEGLGQEHRHGRDEAHRHGWVELVLRRRGESVG